VNKPASPNMPAADANLLQIIAGLRAENAALQAKIAFNQRINDELQESKRLLDEAQRIARLGTWEFDPEQQTIRWSDEVFRIAGMTPRPEVPTFEEYLKIVHPDDRAKLEASVNGLFSSGEGYELELRHLRPDGTYNYVITKAEPVFSEGKAVKIIGSVLDITERKHSEDVLRQAKEAADRANKMKSDFLSSVSHELRTPLTSIRGFASLIEREFSRSFMPLAGEDSDLQKKSQRIRDNLGILLKESERLTRLINDVLDLAKIEAGRVEWRDAPIRPETLVRDAANAAHGMFDAKSAVSLHLEIQEALPPFIGDADRMLQVLVNLLNNAAKFTEQGTVTVKAFLNEQKLIQLEVHDTGIGFPPEDAEVIFDKFQQSRHGDTLGDRPRGTGLGLAISQEIVGRHGGRIWASSDPGKGSVFILTLPAALDDMEPGTLKLPMETHSK